MISIDREPPFRAHTQSSCGPRTSRMRGRLRGSCWQQAAAISQKVATSSSGVSTIGGSNTCWTSQVLNIRNRGCNLPGCTKLRNVLKMFLLVGYKSPVNLANLLAIQYFATKMPPCFITLSHFNACPMHLDGTTLITTLDPERQSVIITKWRQRAARMGISNLTGYQTGLRREGGQGVNERASRIMLMSCSLE